MPKLQYVFGVMLEVSSSTQSWERVDITRFDLSLYEPHVQLLRTYAWKPLVMQDAAKRFQAFLCVVPCVISQLTRARFQDAGQEIRAPLNDLWNEVTLAYDVLCALC